MRLFTVRRRAAVLSGVCLLGAIVPGIAACQKPETLAAEAPIWDAYNGMTGHAYLPVTVHGKAATLLVDLENTGPLQLSTAALGQLGLDLGQTNQLDSITVGNVVERDVPVGIGGPPDWSAEGPPNTPPVIGIAGTQFLARYDVQYDFPKRQVRFYKGPAQADKSGVAWLPPGTKPSDCGRMIRIPPPNNAGTFTAVEMKLDGHPVTGVLEMGPYQEKMNQAAVTALGLTDTSSRVEPIPAGTLPAGYSHNGYEITKQVPDVHMMVGSHTFWTGPVQIFPSIDVEEYLKPGTPVMLMNLSSIRNVVLFNSVSSGQVCFSEP